MTYATRIDLEQLGLPPEALDALESRTPGCLTRALDAASALADGYLRAAYTVPLQTWGDDLRQCVCSLAASTLLISLGLNPESSDALLIRERYKQATRWLELVAAKKIHPTLVETGAAVDGAAVISDSNRGWTTPYIHDDRGW